MGTATALRPSRNGLNVPMDFQTVAWLVEVMGHLQKAKAELGDEYTDKKLVRGLALNEEEYGCELSTDDGGMAVFFTSPPINDDGDAIRLQVSIFRDVLRFNLREWFIPSGKSKH